MKINSLIIFLSSHLCFILLATIFSLTTGNYDNGFCRFCDCRALTPQRKNRDKKHHHATVDKKSCPGTGTSSSIVLGICFRCYPLWGILAKGRITQWKRQPWELSPSSCSSWVPATAWTTSAGRNRLGGTTSRHWVFASRARTRQQRFPAGLLLGNWNKLK